MAAFPDEIPETGAVFTFGRSRFADDEPSHFFIKNDPVVAISCGDEHSAVICNQGRVFVFGGNSCGQLGLGHTDEVTRPSCVKWLKPHRARHVACGRAHTVFVTEANAIYTTGHNENGQLGMGDTETQCVPQYVELPGEGAVRQVAAGASHTAVLTESGQVFVCGSNTEGQLGLGEDLKQTTSFTQVKFMERIAFVECGYYHTIFITSQGVVFVTGENVGYRQGTNNTAVYIYVPEVLPVEVPIKSACCGASHTFLLSMDESRILAFGSNEKGQLGLPKSVVDVTMPTDIPIENMFDGNQLKLIACGAMHTAFVTDNGWLYTCGESKNNKLCLDEVINVDDSNETNQYIPKRVTAMNGLLVDNVACGGCHTILTATRIVDSETNQSSVDTEQVKQISLTELPPLQKIPLVMKKSIELPSTKTVEAQYIPLKDDKNGNEKSEDDKSIDSLEANVSGSHIVNINDLDADNGNGSIHEVPDILDEINSNPVIELDESKATMEDIIKPVVEDTIMKTVQTKPGENCDECQKKNLKVIQDINEVQNSPPPKTPPQNLLHPLDFHTRSPETDRRSAGSQKSETLSKSENETIICESENDKASPLQENMTGEKLSKTQAVMPIMRNDDSMSAVERHVDDVEEAAQSMREKGRLSRIFQSIRDKEASCMGKGKVIENVVTETVHKGINDAEETVHKVEETVETQIRNQTNSNTCILL